MRGAEKLAQHSKLQPTIEAWLNIDGDDMADPDDRPEPAAPGAPQSVSPPYPAWPSIKARVRADLPKADDSPVAKAWTDLLADPDDASKQD